VVLTKLREELGRLRGLVQRAVDDYQGAEQQKRKSSTSRLLASLPPDFTR